MRPAWLVLAVGFSLTACGSTTPVRTAAVTQTDATTGQPTTAAPPATTAPQRTRPAPTPPPAQEPARPPGPAAKTLHVVLAALSPPSGGGDAMIRVYVKQLEVCWSFSKLTGLATPSGAAIGFGDVGGGNPLFPLGAHFASTGCTRPPVAPGALQTMVTTPGDYFVEISTGLGASAAPRLRGQLAPGTAVSAAPTA